MEADVNTPHLKARLQNVFPKFGDDMLKTVGIGEFTAGDSAIIGAAYAGVGERHEARRRSRLAQREPLAHAGGLQGDHRRLGEDQRVAARTRHHAAALGRRARAVHHARVRREAQGARRRRQRARRLALHQRHRAAERAAVQDAEGSRHPDGHELRRHADLADEPVARALLRRDRQERARRAHQRGPDARRATTRSISTPRRTAGSSARRSCSARSSPASTRTSSCSAPTTSTRAPCRTTRSRRSARC